MIGYYRLKEDSSIESRSKQVDESWLPLSDLETTEDGEYYTYYKQDGTPDLDKIKQEEQHQAYELHYQNWLAEEKAKEDKRLREEHFRVHKDLFVKEY